MAKKFSLGRGLDALVDTAPIETQGAASINEIDIRQIYPNPDQPRKQFDAEALEGLATSIRELGVISPITVRKDEQGRYMIIAGERRYRAAKAAGLTSLPAYVRTVNDEQVMELALIENIQREDLDAIEIALAYERLVDEYHLSLDELSTRVGKSRPSISNYLRLLHLPAEIQMGVKDRKIDMGHARALLAIADSVKQLEIYKRVIDEGLTVRQVEQLAQQNKPAKADKKTPSLSDLDVFQTLQQRLSDLFAKEVKLTCNAKGRGSITIPFANDDELDAIMQKLDQIR